MVPVLALLRGINVGGHARLPMAELRSVLSDAGFSDVRTHLQIGNLILTPSSEDLDTLGTSLGQAIEDGFGLTVRVIIRTGGELGDVVGRNPFLEPDMKLSTLHTVLLDSVPEPDRVADLDPDRSPPDRFAVSGKEIFLHYPQGSGRSKLSLDYFERRLGVAGTARNWNTVTALLEKLGG